MNFKLCGCLAIAVALPSAQAATADFPARPVTLVVPYAAGGPMDLVARQLAASIKAHLPTPIVVENRGGAGGSIGTRHVTRSTADGYTLLLNHIGLATLSALYPDLRMDVKRDLAPLAVIADVPMIVVVREPSTIKNAEDLLARARAGALNWGTAGNGSASSLCSKLLSRSIKVEQTEIAYKGTGPALVDLMGGQIDVICDLVTNVKPMIDGGKLRPIVSVTPKRNSLYPQVRTTAELGIGTPQNAVWYGVFAPARTPEADLETLRNAMVAAIGDTQYKAQMERLGATVPAPDQTMPQQLSQRLASDIARFAPLLRPPN